MNSAKPSNWKSKYIAWYRAVESVFGDDVPHLTDEKITDYVSNEDWIIVPVVGEEDKEDAKKADRPNLFFYLSEEGKISFGITYDKLESVERLRNIISPFNEKERNEIIEKLAALDNAFLTKVYRKIKKNYWAESPTYEEVFVEHSNKMNNEQFLELFKTVDKIMDERNLLEKGKKYRLAPAINIVNVEIDREQNNFKKMLSKTKPIYEVTLKVRTREEFEKEIIEHKTIEAKKKQEAFAKYVEELKEKLGQNIISIEEYRTLIMEYQNRQRRA
jgi:hypothetical protein